MAAGGYTGPAGYIGLCKRVNEMRRATSRAFTLIELLVVIAVISVLASITMPSILSAMRQASATQCKSNLRQIGAANMLYASNNGQFLPCYGDWYPDGYEARLISPPWAVLPYLKDELIYLCPSDPTPADPWWWNLNHFTLTKSSYMWNEHLMTIDSFSCGRSLPVGNIPRPFALGLISDGRCMPNGWTWVTAMPYPLCDYSRIDWEHDGGVNMLYADQHIKSVKHVDLPKIPSDPKL
jgi:prepilin-type N-terminal cleavage/methylation domain-containing protein/prepilin-type processing-associated H-X9-DG protein